MQFYVAIPDLASTFPKLASRENPSADEFVLRSPNASFRDELTSKYLSLSTSGKTVF